MLYLAEVRKKAGFMGGGKAELKLLACQQGDKTWNSVSGEEVTQTEEASNFNPDTLVLVDIVGKRAQRIRSAGPELVKILQSLSRSQGQSKSQDEEIEQWKESLMIQSQALNQRQLEIETREDQLAQAEEDAAQVEQQRQEVEASRTEVEQLRAELERKTQELEGAWAHLHGETRKLEERQDELQNSAALDDGQVQQLQDALNRLDGTQTSTDTLKGAITSSLEQLGEQQGILDQHWQNLEQEDSSAQQEQGDIDQQFSELEGRWQAWHNAQADVDQVQIDADVQQRMVQVKQEYRAHLSQQLEAQSSFCDQLVSLASGSSVDADDSVDLQALEGMPIDELQGIVQELQRGLEKDSRFVHDQEEELKLVQQEIQDLQNQIQQASEFDKLQMETNLTEEQDRYRMLNEPLVGQRKRLQVQQGILKQHQSILNRRQGLPLEEGETPEIDLGPVIAQAQETRQQLTQTLEALDQEIQDLQGTMDQTKAQLQQRSEEHHAAKAEIQQFEQDLLTRRSTVAERWGKVNLYREMLQPIQDNLNNLRHTFETMTGLLDEAHATEDGQTQVIAELRNLILSLADQQTPEMATS